MTEVMKEINYEAAFQHFEDEDKFYKALAKPGKKILMVGNREQLATVIEKYKYKPFYGYAIAGMKTIRSCFYVRNDSPFKSVKDLNGKSVVMADTVFEYALIRETLGMPPNQYFKSVKMSGDAESPAYTFFLERQDALFTTEQQVAYLKLMNPSILQNTRKLDCSRSYAFLPFLASPDISDDLAPKILNSIHKVLGSNKASKFMSLLRALKFRMYKCGLEDYESTLELYDMAVKKGWAAEYRNKRIEK
jgi:ABC-type phosphate/phosphonate transport system substrate-binding protein